MSDNEVMEERGYANHGYWAGLRQDNDLRRELAIVKMMVTLAELSKYRDDGFCVYRKYSIFCDKEWVEIWWEPLSEGSDVVAGDIDLMYLITKKE